jgi:NAD+ kinase
MATFLDWGFGMSQFTKIGLIGRLGSDAAFYSLNRLILFLQTQGVEVYLDEETAASAPVTQIPRLARDELADTCDLVIVVGGDGSLLSSARAICRTGVPLLGINRGHLGFLTDISPDEIEVKVGDVLAGNYVREERFLLDSQVYRDGRRMSSGSALNDVVLHPGEYIRMIEFDLYIDQQFVYHQRSDGLIISTPTGSTAYALSVGGPIMHPGLDALVVVPLNPHTLSSRPIVVQGNAEIKVVVSKTRDLRPHVTSDGQTHQVTQPGDEVIVRKKPEKLCLIHPKDHDFYEVCRTKLGWAAHIGNFNS